MRFLGVDRKTSAPFFLTLSLQNYLKFTNEKSYNKKEKE